MTLEDQLQQFYADIDAGPDAEQRIAGAVGAARPTRDRRTVVAAALTSAAVIVAAGLFVLLRAPAPTPGPAGTPPPRPSSRTTTGVVLPPRLPSTVTGAVLDKGRPVTGATVRITAWANSATLERLGRGKPVPAKPIGTVETDAHGSYVVHVPERVLGKDYVDGHALNIELDVFLPSGHQAMWNVPLEVRGGARTAAKRVVFDLGLQTITVDRETSHLPVN